MEYIFLTTHGSHRIPVNQDEAYEKILPTIEENSLTSQQSKKSTGENNIDIEQQSDEGSQV
jgi:hypothetical protein